MIKINKPNILLFALFVILFIASYQKFYVKAKSVVPDKDTSVLIDQKNPHLYKKNIHLDGNLDGKITVGEQKLAQTFIVKSLQQKRYREMHNFVSTLNIVDRRLIQGLSYETAKKAVHMKQEKKYELINYNVPVAQKVKAIKKIY